MGETSIRACRLRRQEPSALPLRIAYVASVLAAVWSAELCAETPLPWPARNGPYGTGCAAPADAQEVPSRWDETSGENIAWKIELEGVGHSTPVIGHGRLWFTAATEDGTRQSVYAIDARNGEILHHRLLFENPMPEPLGNAVNTYASPSCVLEDDAVYVHFGSYGTARLDPATGEVVWQRRDLPCRHFRGPGSSPIVSGNLLVLTFDGIDQQYVTALDKRTGATVWRTDRSTDYHDIEPDGKPKLDGDLRKAYGTPAAIEVAGQKQLVSIGSRAIFGYDIETGKEIWTVTHSDFNAAAPPLFFENRAIVNTGSGGAAFMAIRLDGSTRGDVTESHIDWRRTKGNSRLAAPALADGRISMLTDNGVLYTLDARTGEELGSLRLGGAHVASPVVVGDRLIACDEAGKSYVVRRSVPAEVVAENTLAEGMRASPAVAAGALYLRTFHRLYKIAGSGR